jgi:hypothetical protein
MVANGGGDLLKLIQSGMDVDEPEQPAKAAAIATLAILTMSRTRNIDPCRPWPNLSRTIVPVKTMAVKGRFRDRASRFVSLRAAARAI